LVDSVESMTMHGLVNPKKKIICLSPWSSFLWKPSETLIYLW